MKISKRMVAALAVAAIGGPVAVTMAQADDPPPAAPPTSTVPVAATADQKEAFAILAASPTSADEQNDRIARLADAAQRGLDAEGARVVGSTDAGPIWLVPANGALCLALEDTGDDSVGTSCEPSEDVIARGITVGDGSHVYGLVPDGVTSIDVTDDEDVTTTHALDSGSSVYTLGDGHVTVGLDGPDGPQSFDVEGGG
ncbi:MAG: hypothetical protein JWQ18_2319 [Conexibacter sp.]|nr:hypothetical protein [Conexibacter sp.]